MTVKDYGSVNVDGAETRGRRLSLNEKKKTLRRSIQMRPKLASSVPVKNVDSRYSHSGGVYENIFRPGKKLTKQLLSPSQLHSRTHQEEQELFVRKQRHSFMYTMLNSNSRQRQAVIFKKAMTLIILIDVAFFIASTEPGYGKHSIFYYEEAVVSTFFLVEYIIRLVTITESQKYRKLGPIMGRLKYMCSFHALVDAFATFPFFLEILMGGEKNLPHLTYIRFFRLMRILRTDSLGKAIDSLQRVLYYNREILYVAGVMAVGLIMFTAVLMYYLRPREIGADEKEWSLTTAIYYSTLMLTGQGGPEGDLPWYTRSVVLLTGLFSIGMFAIPASMLTWGFEAEAARVAAKTRKRHLRKLAGEPIYSSSSSSSSASSYSNDNDDLDSSASSSDEEYLKLIAGEDDASAEGGNTVIEESLKEILSVVSSKDTRDFHNPSQEVLVARMDILERKVDKILGMLKARSKG